MTKTLTKEQAKLLMLRKQGLLGDYRFENKQSILDYVKQVGCLQFDPIDICGRNADLVLFSRIKDYRKKMLGELLYEDRLLVDQWDKNMAIHHLDDWPYLKTTRNQNAKAYEQYGLEQPLIDHALAVLSQKEYVEAHDLDIEMKSHFFTWRHKKLSQAILDYLFFKGDVIIHHRKGVKRYFCLAGKHLDTHILNNKLTNWSLEDYHKWQILRRVSALGLLWSRRSDAFLGITGLTTPQMKVYFSQLEQEGKLIGYQIEDTNEKLYMLTEDEQLISGSSFDPRLEFLAPLDNFLWDRKLISFIFGFDYTWEIYVPAEKRKFGAYVLPILYGTDFVGRIEVVVDRKQKILMVRNIWLEKKVDAKFDKAFKKRLLEFAQFNDCDSVENINKYEKK